MVSEKTLTPGNVPAAPGALVAALLRSDGWKNLLIGSGDLQRDARMSMTPTIPLLTRDHQRALWRGNDMAGNIVERPAFEMTRAFAEIRVANDKTVTEALTANLETLDAQRKFKEAIEFQRAYGGAAILVGANDRSDIAGLYSPLQLERIQSVDYLNVFEARDLPALEFYDNPLEANYGKVKIYGLTPRLLGLSGQGMIAIHESRLLVFDGLVTSLEDRIAARGWGQSSLDRCDEAIRGLGISWDAASALLKDFAQAVFKIKGLADAIASDNEQLVLKRLQIMDISRSYLRGLALDADGEDFERKPTPISGLAELLDRLCNRVAAAAKMPVTLLFGQAPAGLNATGDSDLTNWSDSVASMQRMDVKPQLERLASILLRSRSGPTKGNEPENWGIFFFPLRQLTDVEKSQILSNIATADEKNIVNQVYTPEEAASHYQGDQFSIDVQLDKNARDAFARTDPLEGEPTPRVGENQVDPQNDPGNPAPQPVEQPINPGAPALPGGVEAASDTALNGAQVTAAVGIVEKVALGQLPRDTGVGMLEEFFNLPRPRAEKIMGSVGTSFVPKKEDPLPEPKPAPIAEPAK